MISANHLDATGIQDYLAARYPDRLQFLFSADPISRIRPDSGEVLEAVVRVVCGQMLSRKAARSNYDRLVRLAGEEGLEGTWLLEESSPRKAGLSGGKANTIRLIGQRYADDASQYLIWPQLDWPGLRNKVNSERGLSDWSAATLAIFHFGHEDVFPEGDGSSQRCCAAMSSITPRKCIDIEAAVPYRSYLALALRFRKACLKLCADQAIISRRCRGLYV